MKRDIQVVAISPQGSRIEGRLGDVAPVVGDILLLRGARSDIADALRDTQSVPIATQALLFGGSDAAMPLIVFGGSIVLAATGILPTAIAFGGAVLLMALTGVLNLRNALRDLNWPVIIMLAAMLPIGEALATTGTAELIARSALGVLGPTSEIVLVAGMLLVAVIITPFLNNVTTAILLAPIAVAVGAQSGIPPEPLLVAVAVGASTDFLTPFGHHNNTLVMGLGHYRFGDFPRVGAPLTLLVLVTAPPIIIALF
jgi:di/tricarboxylate transporter